VIEKDMVVTLEYTVTDPDGTMVDEGREDLVYLHGGYGDIYPSIEAALEGKDLGDRVMVKLQPAEAYGEYDPDLVQVASVADLPQPVTLGMQIEAGTDEHGNPGYVRVTDMAEGKAILDGNHPWAGIALVFSCTVVDVRRASPGDIAQRRMH
jgi:FKBP-type peptidyl-prolyl cis-trans isomerase SlyD